MENKRIFEKFKEIEDNLMIIEDNLPTTFEEFKNLGLLKDGIYKRLEHSIENIIDICAMVYTHKKLGIPNDDDDILDGLKTILPAKTINLVRKMKGLRNVLVHKYGKIDDELVFEVLQNNLTDFDEIQKEIIANL